MIKTIKKNKMSAFNYSFYYLYKLSRWGLRCVLFKFADTFFWFYTVKHFHSFWKPSSLTHRLSWVNKMDHILFTCVKIMCIIELIFPFWFEHLNTCFIRKKFMQLNYEVFREKRISVFSTSSSKTTSCDSLCAVINSLWCIHWLYP